jgi:DNA-binding transcriptional LysR family regulator
LELVMDDRDKDLVAENIDAALRLGVLPDSALVARKLAQAQMLAVASPAYVARKGVPRTPTDLLKHEGIIFSRTGEDWVFRHGNSETPVRIPRRLTFSAAEGVRAAVIAGLGFTVSSRWIFGPELESGEVVPLLKDWLLPPDELWVIYPSGQLTSSKARAFVNWFEKTFTQGAADGNSNQLQRAASPQAR